MPINTSFSGNIPWLLTEPPTVALARGAQVGEGIAHQRLAQQQITLQAAQQAEQVARDRAIEAHRKIQEGIEQSQEARQQALFAKTASNELSRRIGMKMINDDLEIWSADNPDASPEAKMQATTRAVLKNADNVFPDGQGFAPFLQHTQDMLGKVGLNQALIDARESTVRKNDAAAEKMKTETWLGPGNTGSKAFAPSNTERIIEEASQRGIKFTPQELEEAYKVAVGVQPRERKATQELRGKFISEHLQKALEAEKESPTGALSEGIFGHFRKPTPKTRDEVVKDLGDLYDKVYGPPGANAAPASVAPETPAAPATNKLIFDPSTGSFKPAR